MRKRTAIRQTANWAGSKSSPKPSKTFGNGWWASRMSPSTPLQKKIGKYA